MNKRLIYFVLKKSLDNFLKMIYEEDISFFLDDLLKMIYEEYNTILQIGPNFWGPHYIQNSVINIVKISEYIYNARYSIKWLFSQKVVICFNVVVITEVCNQLYIHECPHLWILTAKISITFYIRCGFKVYMQ